MEQEIRFPQEIHKRIFLGLDLAFTRDYAVVAVIEQRKVYDIPSSTLQGAVFGPGGLPYIRFVDRLYVLKQLKRFPHETISKDIVAEMKRMYWATIP